MRFKTSKEFFDYTSSHRTSLVDVTEEERYQHFKARLQSEMISTVVDALSDAGLQLTKDKGE